MKNARIVIFFLKIQFILDENIPKSFIISSIFGLFNLIYSRDKKAQLLLLINDGSLQRNVIFSKCTLYIVMILTLF